MFRKNFYFQVSAADGAKTAGMSVSETDMHVTAEDLYDLQSGYGFVTEKNRPKQKLLQLPELNSGFVPMYWYQGKLLTEIRQDEDGCFVDSKDKIKELAREEGSPYPGEPRRIPLCFKADVPKQGNYHVKITIRADEDMEDVLIFTGRRRLAYHGRIAAGKELQLETMVNVCDIIPRGQNRVYEDTTVDITVVADKPRLTQVSIVEETCPTIYIAGDSTVTDQSAEYPYAPGTSYAGWGQMLTAYLNCCVAVSNHAHSGLTTDSFRNGGHYSVVQKYWKPGDYCFIQFAHNDQKLKELTAQGGYRANLLRYIEECRACGVYPVLVTPLARNSWKGDGTYNDFLQEYADEVKRVGQETDVPVLDLHGRSKAFIMRKGLEAAKAFLFPEDFTHSNDYGAYIMAGFVAGEMYFVCGQHENRAYRSLAACVEERFDEWRSCAEIVLPVKPALYESVENPGADGLLFSEIDELDEKADRAAVIHMLVKTAKYFPTNVYNDMYEDIVGHEWYAGAVETACQNGMILPELVENGCLFPEREVTLEELLVLAMNVYASRKGLPKREPCTYDCCCADYARDYIRAAYNLGLLAAEGSEDLHRTVSRGEVVELCRAMRI